MVSTFGAPLMALLALVTILTLFAVLLLAQRLRPVERAEVEEVAELSDLDVTIDNVGLVVDAIARTRLWRTVGVLVAVAGCVGWVVVVAMREQRLTFELAFLLWGLIGYWAGSVVAELRTAQTDPGDGPRTASLERRELTDYVGSWAAVWPRRLGLAGAIAGALALATGSRDPWVIGFGLGAAAISVAGLVVAQYVLERSRPDLAPDVAAADDAVRSRSLHAIGGATVGIGIWAASIAVAGAILTLAARAVGDDPSVVLAGETQLLGGLYALVLVVFCVVLPVTGFVVGRRLGRRPFPVRRRDSAVEAPA
jgi:hypothetical protein